MKHKASSVQAAGYGGARCEHVQQRPQGRGARGQEAADGQGPRLPPPLPRPPGDEVPWARQLGEMVLEALKTQLVNLVQSRYHRTHLKRGS